MSSDTTPPVTGHVITVDYSVQPGPDGTPWVGLHIQHGPMVTVIMVSPGQARIMGEALGAGLPQAADAAIAADEAAIRKTVSAIPANALDALGPFKK